MNRIQRISLLINGVMLALAAIPFTLLALFKGSEDSLVIGIGWAALFFAIFAGGATLCLWGATAR